MTWKSIAILVVGSAHIAAAAAPSGSPATQGRSTNETTHEKEATGTRTLTVTGCLQRGAARDPGHRGTAAFFVLLQASASTAKQGRERDAVAPTRSSTPDKSSVESRRSPATDRTGTPEFSGPGTIFVLDGRDDELRQFVGERVEVTGVVTGSSAGGQVSRGVSGSVRAAASGASGNSGAGGSTGSDRRTGARANESASAEATRGGPDSAPAAKSGVGSSMEAAQHVNVASVRPIPGACTSRN